MRGKFFLYLLVGLIGLVVAYFVFMVLRAIYVTFMELKSGRELNQLADEYSHRRQQQLDAAHARLDNACAHEFEDDGGALPPDVCCKCGLARDRPDGECDHTWERLPGIIPQSACTKCGQKYSSVLGSI